MAMTADPDDDLVAADDDIPLSSSMGAAQDPITAFCASLWFWRLER